MRIELRRVSKAYGSGQGRFWALRDVSLTVDQGTHLAIVGPSGSGKSTLLHLLGCLDVPTEGEVLLDGVSRASLSDRQVSLVRRSRMGFVFQQYYLNEAMTALQNVLLPLELGRVADRRNKAIAALEWVGLEHKLDALPSEMSGGEQQRVAIARAVANGPELVLADEPTGNLDSESGNKVLDVLEALHSERGTGLVLVTHDDRFAARATHVLRVRDGRLT